MSDTVPASTFPPKFQPIINRALSDYKKKTRKDLITDPLAEEIRGCDSPDAILAVLRRKANELNQYQNSDERLTKWLTPTVNVLNALSSTLGQSVGIVSPSMFRHNLMSNFRFPPLPRSSLPESISSLW
jgi:hypothetical protein